jgi:hypothetical protein
MDWKNLSALKAAQGLEMAGATAGLISIWTG